MVMRPTSRCLVAVLVDARTSHNDVAVLDAVHDRAIERVLAALTLLRRGSVGAIFGVAKDVLLDLCLAAAAPLV